MPGKLNICFIALQRSWANRSLDSITILQLSKVDPEELSKDVKSIDRRSTILLAASRSGRFAEKGHTEEEEPSIDALRGLAGIPGSIHRIRSARRSMMSDTSVMDEHGVRRRSTRTSSGLPRHQLSDKPIPLPDDYAENISMHTGHSNAVHTQKPKSSHIQFASEASTHDHPHQGQTEPVIDDKELVRDEADIPMASFGHLPTLHEESGVSLNHYKDPFRSDSSNSSPESVRCTVFHMPPRNKFDP